MYNLYGNVGCSRCIIAQRLLKKKGIEFSYTHLNDLSEEDRKVLVDKAREAGKVELPLIVKDDKFFGVEDIK